MTKTIAINAGSSSLKWQLYEMPDEVVLAKGLIERIGLKDSVSTVKFDDRSESQTLDIADHVQAVKILLDDLIRFDIIKMCIRDRNVFKVVTLRNQLRILQQVK